MTNQKKPQVHANVFRRDTLQCTVRLLRGNNPGLALSVQNTFSPNSSQQVSGAATPEPGDLFALDFQPQLIDSIIDAITTAAQEIAELTLRTGAGDESELRRTINALDSWHWYAKQSQRGAEISQAAVV